MGWVAGAEGDSEGFGVTPQGYEGMARGLRGALGRGAPVLSVVEGGYHPQALPASAVAWARGLATGEP
jgi:acetoin utilization deacetylase AcuC-like enzyme